MGVGTTYVPEAVEAAWADEGADKFGESVRVGGSKGALETKQGRVTGIRWRSWRVEWGGVRDVCRQIVGSWEPGRVGVSRNGICYIRLSRKCGKGRGDDCCVRLGVATHVG